MWLVLLIFYIVAGLVVLVCVAFRPQWFWPFLIVMTVGTAGLVVRGYAFVDEYFLGAMLFGILLVILIGKLPLVCERFDRYDAWHQWVFFFMALYMIGESLRGMAIQHDLRLARWVLYYGMLAVLPFVLFLKTLRVPRARNFFLLIVGSALIYFLVYLGHGFFSEIWRGISRWKLQGDEWSGTAYAMFPLMIAIPAVLFLLRERKKSLRWLAYALIIVAFTVTYYYDSRTGLITILSFLMISPMVLKFRSVKPILVMGLILFIYFGVIHAEKFIQVAQNFTQLYQHASEIYTPSKVSNTSDIDRSIHFRAAFTAVNDSWSTRLFGYGVNAHKSVLGVYIQPLKAQYLHLSAPPPANVRTTGFTALLVDSGFIGVLLFALNVLLVARKILQIKIFSRFILLLSLGLLCLWLTISNLQDVVLLYFMIMPSGLLVQLAQTQRESLEIV